MKMTPNPKALPYRQRAGSQFMHPVEGPGSEEHLRNHIPDIKNDALQRNKMCFFSRREAFLRERATGIPEEVCNGTRKQKDRERPHPSWVLFYRG